MAEDGGPDALSFAFVAIVRGKAEVYTMGMHIMGLRDSVMKTVSAKPEKQIELGVGPLTLNLARAGLAFVELDPEVRKALHVVRSAEVGVYKLRNERQRLG
jgi:hypothetical protein